MDGFRLNLKIFEDQDPEIDAAGPSSRGGESAERQAGTPAISCKCKSTCKTKQKDGKGRGCPCRTANIECNALCTCGTLRKGCANKVSLISARTRLKYDLEHATAFCSIFFPMFLVIHFLDFSRI